MRFINKNVVFLLVIFTILLLVACEKEIKLEKDELMVPEGYNILVDKANAKDLINYKKIDIPTKVNELNLSLLGLINKEEFVVFLHEKNDGEEKSGKQELGIYNIKTREYKRISPLEKNQLHQIVSISNKYIVFKLTEDGWKTVSLHLYSINDEKFKQIFDYTKEKQSGSVIMHGPSNICIIDDFVYFDDIIINDQRLPSIHLHEYDCISDKTRLLKKNGANPIKHKQKVAYLTESTQFNYNVLKTIDNVKLLELESEPTSLNTNGDLIYALCAKDGNNIELRDLVNDNELFNTERIIANVKLNDKYVTWFDYGSKLPSLYSIKDQKFLVFSEIKGGLSMFFVNEDFVILANEADGKIEYYYFD